MGLKPTRLHHAPRCALPADAAECSIGRHLRLLALLLMVGWLTACATAPTTGSGRAAPPEQRLRAHLNLAEGYIEAGELERAKKALERAAEVDPRSWKVHNLWALIYQRQGDSAVAEDHFRAALRFADEASRVHNDYGVFLFEEDRFPEAVEQLERAVRDPANPQRAVAYQNLGLALLEIDERTDARNAFARAVMLDERMARSLLELAELAYTEGDYAQAAAYYQRYRSLARQTPKSLWLGIRLARVARDEDAVASYGLQLRNLYPYSEEYRLFEASGRDG